MIRLFIMFCLSAHFLIARAQKNEVLLDTAQKSKIEAVQEKKIISRLLQLREVKEANKNIDSVTNHKHGIAFLTLKRPDTSGNYYWIQAGFNNETRYIPYYNFYVYYKNMDIQIFDPITNKAYELSKWRKKNKNK